ncbi:hypothetical protein MKZ38_010399 [Zalerion maritima]|uniref:Uncharacterized protein n=1 Tax=Zalerion maritima TaxID=339359 RepID=A0AAD5RU18_9PEZI|nr:hypothetical protein MKZ38_010399 [Zalerion maritima]
MISLRALLCHFGAALSLIGIIRADLCDQDVNENGDPEMVWCCGISNWGGAHDKRILQGIEYLTNKPQDVEANFPDEGCYRISCSWDSAIVVCNDLKGFPATPTYSRIVEEVITLREKCHRDQDYWNGYLWRQGENEVYEVRVLEDKSC